MKGLQVVKDTVLNLSSNPGVYRMLNSLGDALYVGKAKNLKKRVVYYTKIRKLPKRHQRMVSETTSMEIIETHTELEALLLESNLIKKLKPKYNILLKDNKSFAYIVIDNTSTFPRIKKYRGVKNSKNKYFGPFASADSVDKTLTILQKVFYLRSCEDNEFQNRSRPCLLHQIKRCSAPCVGKITEGNYKEFVNEAINFLKDGNKKINKVLSDKMEKASKEMKYEAAASYRDRIISLSSIQSNQDINISIEEDIDVIAITQLAEQTCIQVFFFRSGQNFGNRAFFPNETKEIHPTKIIEAFLKQFYHINEAPKSILVNKLPDDYSLIGRALSKKNNKQVNIIQPKKGEKKNILEHAIRNSENALKRRLANRASQKAIFKRLSEEFHLCKVPKRIEAYDNSHTSGNAMIGVMVVATESGFDKKAYRKYNIRESAGTGDDYAAMREVIRRRFEREIKENPNRDSISWPELLIIDGGLGQLEATNNILSRLGIVDVGVIAISKGKNRNLGDEKIHQFGRQARKFDKTDPILYFLQRLRDEAHRFAVTSHRIKRSKNLFKSELDLVPGIGTKRKKSLLNNFGSIKNIKDAAIEDLLHVDGINKSLAIKIYNFFH